jgi:hypothetical protein
MLLFLSLTGIWSYAGTCLTESILPSVMLWIFISYVNIVMKDGQVWWKVLINAVGMSLLGILLKPWIMVTVVMASVFLWLGTLVWPALRTRKWSILLLMTINLISFAAALSYSRQKSAENANIALLIISSGNEPVLEKRLQTDKGLTPDSAHFIQNLLKDINTVNQQFKGNIWEASWSGKLTILNINDPKQKDSIRKAFGLMYFKRPSDFSGLLYLSFYRYISEMELGLKCLDISYGPQIPLLAGLANPFWLIVGLISLIWIWRAGRNEGSFIPRMRRWLFKDKVLWIFTCSLVLSGIFSCLLLCIAGGDELRRTVLPPVLFQLFTLVYYEGKKGESPAGKILQD